MKLTIAQFSNGLKLAGLERVVVDLAIAFKNRGHDSLVCTTMFGGELVSELSQADVPFKCLGLKRSYDPRALLPVMRYLKKNSVDVVITHGKSGCLIPRMAAILSRTPVFIHVEHSISDEKKCYHIITNKILSLFTNKIVCVSEKARQSLIAIEKTALHKILVIHNGLDTSRLLSDVSEVYKEDQSKRRVGIVARFNEVKGHKYFVEAATRIVQSYKNVQFIFVGDGPLRLDIEQKVRECNLEQYCNFLGERTDVGKLLRTFDVFVLSSLWEGLPISLLEAQSLGIASVATDVGGIPEIITNGYNGLLVPSKNPEALAQAILKILSDEQLMNDIGMHSKEVILQNFSVDKMTNNYLILIDSLLDKVKEKVIT